VGEGAPIPQLASERAALLQAGRGPREAPARAQHLAKADKRPRHPLQVAQVAVPNEPSVRLAQRLAELVPGDFPKKVWYGLSGSDASETLGKMVPLATGRPKLISFIGGYHGMTGTSAALTGHQTTHAFDG